MSTSCSAQDADSAVSPATPAQAPVPAIQETPAPEAQPQNADDRPRVVFNKESMVSKVPYTGNPESDTTQMSQAGDNETDNVVKRNHYPRRSTSESSNIHHGSPTIRTRRIGPRRLAGERRQLLDNLVDNVAKPKDASEPASDTPSSTDPAPTEDPSPASSSETPEPTEDPAEESDPEPKKTTDEPESSTSTTTTTTTTTTKDSLPTNEADDTANISSSDDDDYPKSAKANPIVNQPTKSAINNDNDKQLQGIGTTRETHSNATGITIGFLTVAVVIAGVIGVWVFRKWKLEPSKQFKDRMTGTAGGGTAAAAAAAGAYDSKHPPHNDTQDFNGYGGIYGHDSAVIPPQPPMEHVGASPSIAAAVMVPPQAVYQQPLHAYGYHNEEYDNQYNSQDYQQHHPQQQHQEYNQDYNQNYNQEYNQDYSYSHHENFQGYQEYSGHQEFPQYPQARPTHMSMSSVPESMADYGPYGAAGSRRPSAMSSSNGHTGHNMNNYGSEDYSLHDHQFLRELRE
ncbi:hypothetical protein BGZ76_008381 [Entomortierella beljakovae]|nr:hypothetical protein BGZ76_008381 [Entomortierella beljakovae]